VGHTDGPRPGVSKVRSMPEHAAFLIAGDLRSIVGDDTDHGYGRDQHSGLWYLASTHDRRNVVAGGASILAFSHHRGSHPTIRTLEDGAVELRKDAAPENDHVATRGVYRLVAPHYVDYEMTARQERPGERPASPFPMSWCCYMESPTIPGIHFLEEGRWRYHYDTVHGQAATVFAAGMPDERRHRVPDGEEPWDGRRPFNRSDSGYSYDHPFYFGIIRDMIFVLMADPLPGLRFFMSPSGGGPAIVPGARNPAWDLELDDPFADGPQVTLGIRIAYRRLERTAEQPNGYAADIAWNEYVRFRDERGR
jgi:hypothetical protein